MDPIFRDQNVVSILSVLYNPMPVRHMALLFSRLTVAHMRLPNNQKLFQEPGSLCVVLPRALGLSPMQGQDLLDVLYQALRLTRGPNHAHT